MSPAEKLLPHLENVREVSPGQYQAKCPGHADKTPSLSVRDLGDRVLIFCHAACAPGEVVESVGLTLADLFERPQDHQQKPIHGYQRWDFRSLLKTLRAECGIVLLAANDLARGEPLSDADLERLREAIGRILKVAESAQ